MLIYILRKLHLVIRDTRHISQCQFLMSLGIRHLYHLNLWGFLAYSVLVLFLIILALGFCFFIIVDRPVRRFSFILFTAASFILILNYVECLLLCQLRSLLRICSFQSSQNSNSKAITTSRLNAH